MICGPGLMAGRPTFTCSPGFVTVPTPFPARSVRPGVSTSSTVTTIGVPCVQSRSSPASLRQVAMPVRPCASADSTGIVSSVLCGERTVTCFGNSPRIARIAAFIAPVAVAPVVCPSRSVFAIISSAFITPPIHKGSTGSFGSRCNENAAPHHSKLSLVTPAKSPAPQNLLICNSQTADPPECPAASGTGCTPAGNPYPCSIHAPHPH